MSQILCEFTSPSSCMCNQDTKNICFEGYRNTVIWNQFHTSSISINSAWVPLRSFLCSALLTFYSLLDRNKSFRWLRTSSFSGVSSVIPLSTVSSGFCSVTRYPLQSVHLFFSHTSGGWNLLFPQLNNPIDEYISCSTRLAASPHKWWGCSE